MKLDVSNQEEAERVAEETVKTFGRIDILVNNAGLQGSIVKPWTEFTPEDWDRKLSVDLKGSFICARAAFPAMKAQRYGKIINTASGVVLLGSRNFLTHVSAKAGVIGFTRALATEVGEYDINVNVVAPGHVDTARGASAGQSSTVTTDRPMARKARPEEIAAVVRHLCMPEGRYVTGQTIHVNGGMLFAGA